MDIGFGEQSFHFILREKVVLVVVVLKTSTSTVPRIVAPVLGTATHVYVPASAIVTLNIVRRLEKEP